MNDHSLSSVKSRPYPFLRRLKPPIQKSKPEYPELVISLVTNGPDGDSKTTENDNKGLKFRKLNDDQIIVEIKEKTKVEHFTEPENKKKLMLYNFKQIERFCERFRKNYCVEEIQTSAYKYYIVVKNFSNEKMHVPGKEAEIYRISRDVDNWIGFVFSVYANGNNDEHKGFVYIDVKREKRMFNIKGNAILDISVIDNEGNEKFTQTEVFYPYAIDKFTDSKKYIPSLCKFISRESVLCNSPEILNHDDLVLCISVTFDRSCKSCKETEKQIELAFEISFETEPNGGYILNLGSDIGKLLCKNSNFFQSKAEETQRLPIPIDEVEDLKNICRLLIGANYIEIYNYETFAILYRMAHRYGIYHVMEFCRRVFKKHALFSNNISLIHDLAESYNDVVFREIVENFRKHLKKYERFLCDVFTFDCEEEESKTVDRRSQHIHYARGEYIQYDNLVNADKQYRSAKACYEEIEAKFNFSSIFNTSENGEITLPLDSNFGNTLCERSNVLKHMLQCQCLDTHTDKIEIPQKDFEAFKNIYRILMKANYIKATTIIDIISLYEVSDFYDIPLVMEICRNLFKMHLCIRNGNELAYLSKRCLGDTELEKIVLSFKADYLRYSDRTRFYYPEWLQSTGTSNFVELDEIFDFDSYNFNFYQ